MDRMVGVVVGRREMRKDKGQRGECVYDVEDAHSTTIS